MKAQALLTVNPLLADRVRLAIMVALAASKVPLDFNTLLTSLELTRGNLSTHLRKLEEGELINGSKEFVDRKPRSSYVVSDAGRKAVKEYLRAIESALTGMK